MIHFSVRSRFVGLAAAALCVVLVGGCSGKGKPTKANFEKIKTDMTAKDVEALMGTATQSIDLKKMMGDLGGIKIPGADVMPADKSMAWVEGDNAFVVLFKDDKVVKKETKKSSEIEKGKTDTKVGDDSKPGGDTKLSKDNIAKVKEGMTKKEIENIIGPGKVSASSGDAETVTWGEGLQVITVTSERGKATTILKVGF